MRKLQVLSVLAVAVTLCGASVASAATWGLGVHGSFNTHSMQEWNDALDEANSSGAEYENVGNDITGGLDVRMWATPNWMFSAGWEPLFLNTEDSVSETELSLNAHAFTVSGAYFFPSSSKAKYGLGAGLGYYKSAGELSSGGSSIDIQGGGIGFHFMGIGEWSMSPGMSFTGGLGYRVANLSDLEITDGVDTADSPYENDYSGVMARAGLSFSMPKAN